MSASTTLGGTGGASVVSGGGSDFVMDPLFVSAAAAVRVAVDMCSSSASSSSAAYSESSCVGAALTAMALIEQMPVSLKDESQRLFDELERALEMRQKGEGGGGPPKTAQPQQQSRLAPKTPPKTASSTSSAKQRASRPTTGDAQAAMDAWARGGERKGRFASLKSRLKKPVCTGEAWEDIRRPEPRISTAVHAEEDADVAQQAEQNEQEHHDDDDDDDDDEPQEPSDVDSDFDSRLSAERPASSTETAQSSQVDLAQNTETGDADADTTVRLAGVNQAAHLSLAGRGMPRLPRILVAPEEDEVLVVETLDISSNRLASLPLGICLHLPLLNRLVAHHNMLEHLPPELCMCRFLQEVDVSHNRLAELPTGLFVSPSLARIDAGANALTVLPPELGMADSLLDLGVANNSLVSIPEEIALLRGIVRIDATSNRMSMLPAALFDGCLRLRLLSVARNRIRKVAPHSAPYLETLDVAYNVLTEGWMVGDGSEMALPRLPQLRQLMAQGNQLGPTLDLDTLLRHVSPKLEVLELANNRLVCVEAPSPRVAYGAKLSTLGVSHNRITMLPDSLGGLERDMRSLACHGNRLRSLPPSLVPALPVGVTLDDVLVRPARDPVDATAVFAASRYQQQKAAGGTSAERAAAEDDRFGDIRRRMNAPALLGFGYGMELVGNSA